MFWVLFFAFVPLICFWLFIRWDQRRINTGRTLPLSHVQMDKGFVPGRSLRWKAEAGVALVTLISSVSELVDPKLPPFHGKWSFLHTALYELFGKYGETGFFGALAVFFAISSFYTYRKSR